MKNQVIELSIDSLIHSDAIVLLSAGTGLTLGIGFEIESGAELVADMTACN